MFTGNEDQLISLSEGSALTANFRAWLEATQSSDPTLGEYHSKALIESILAQDGCVGVRSYYGMDADGKRKLVLVGVTANENDIVDGVLGDRSYKCPPHSGNANSLNS